MLLAAGLVFGGALFSQVQKNAEGEKSEKTPVDIKAEKSYFDSELNKQYSLEDNAMILVGEVVFHHNGAVISCDSAIRYSDRRIDCFKNVIINKDSTFIYGDRAEYNGDLNLARVYSPVVKVVDGDATLYTYNFSMNTATNVGTWFGGGVMYQQDNTMESERGYYYSDLHELVAVRNVEMKNDSHTISSDSVRYNTETKVASFYTKTYIWTREGEIIRADKGRYNTQDSTYFFWDNAYVLDEFRETWADTIDFNARLEDLVMYGNIQIDDGEHESSAFGDFGQYWGERGETMLTKRPSLLNYNADQGNTDTLYMRADTVFMFVIYPSDRRDSLAPEAPDPHAHLRWADSLPDSTRLAIADSLKPIIERLRAESDSLGRLADSIMRVLYPEPVVEDTTALPGDSLPPIDSLPPADTLAQGAADTLLVESPAEEDAPQKRPLRRQRRRDRDRGPHPRFWFLTDSLTYPYPDAVALTDSVAGEPQPQLQPQPEQNSSEAGESAESRRVEAEVDNRVEPPEVKELRARIDEIKAQADSLQTAETYIRPKPAEGGTGLPQIDSLEQLRLDSLARVDSLARADSILRADPVAYKKYQKAAKKAEKRRIREEKRAAKAAARAEKIAERRRRIAEKRGWVTETPYSDSIARADSLLALDSLMPELIDSLEKIDSLPPPAGSQAEPDTTMRIFRGWHDVRIWRKDMQAVCDSMVGFSRDSTVHMYIDPILWHGDNQITSDSITLFTSGEQIERAEFYVDPIMGSQLSGRQYNQVKGRSMTAWFRDSEVYRHDADGNAQVLYYIQEEEEGPDGQIVYTDPQAFLVMTASNISFLIEDQYVNYIVPRDVVDWTIYPIEQIPPAQTTRLQGFVWRIERKPELKDVFDRTVRPTEREAHESMAQPAFPIAARIDRRREYLINNRMWGDRTDPLPAHAIEWVESLQP